MTAPDTEANRDVVRRAFDAWQAGTSPITDVFAPDMVWRIVGRSAASREYASRQEFVDQVMGPFAERFEGGERFRPVAIRAVHADGDTVIVLWDGRGVAKDGVAYENTYAWFLRMRGGEVIDGTAFYDSIAFNELWERVQPRGS
jgi:ketosteroid isomerase-like protein